MSEVFERLGIHSGTLFNYHQTRRKTKNYLSDLELLQYDILYGKQYVYNGKKPITEGHMKMGIRNVTLKNVVPHLDEGYSLYGENFTKSSKVFVNDEKQDSTFLNNTRIEQMGSSDTVFRKSDEYIYKDGKLTVQKGTGTDTTKSWVPQADGDK